MLVLSPIENAIFKILARYQSISMDELFEKIKTNFDVKISKAQLYRYIKKMHEEYIIVKKYGSIKPNTLWLHELFGFAENMKNTHSINTSTAEYLQDGEVSYIYGHDLMELDVVRAHETTKIWNETQPKELYFYDSHLYYTWLNYSTSKVYFSFLGPTNTVYCLVGNTCFLDTYASKQIAQNDHFIFHQTTSSVFLQDGYILRILGDYILEFLLPEPLQNLFAQFYAKVQKIEDFDLDLFLSLFKIKTKCKLTIRRNKKDAEAMKKNIRQFF